MEESNWTGLIALSSVVFGGVILVCVAQMVVMYRYSRDGIRVTGIVDKVSAQSTSSRYPDSGPSTHYSADIRYIVDEKKYTIRPPADTNPPFYKKGQRVPVYFYADRPDRGRVVCFREYAKWLAISIGCGGFLVTIIILSQMLP